MCMCAQSLAFKNLFLFCNAMYVGKTWVHGLHLLINQIKPFLFILNHFKIQWTRQFRVIDSSGSPSHKHVCFFKNVKVYRFIIYPIIIPNLLAAWNLLLIVKFLFTNVVIKKRLTAPLPWKVKILVKGLHPTS